MITHMQTAPEQVEFAGQRILEMDSRAERMLRAACVACGSKAAQSVGVKNELELLRCRECATLYTPYSPWYSSEFFYEAYYAQESLAPPAFVQTRLAQVFENLRGCDHVEMLRRKLRLLQLAMKDVETERTHVFGSLLCDVQTLRVPTVLARGDQ